MTDAIMQLGVGGIFAILVIKEVLNFLNKRREHNGSGGTNKHYCLDVEKRIANMERIIIADNEKINKILDYTDKLFIWHNKTDEDGIPLWYVKRSMEDAVVKLNSTLQDLTRIMDAHFNILERIEKKLNV